MNKSEYTIAIISSHFPTQDYYCFGEFLKSLEGEPIICGGQDGSYKNLSDRPRIFYDAINQGYVKTEWLILSDCWDMVFVDSPSVIFEKHKANNCDITFSCEKNCFPEDLKQQFDEIAPANTPYKYLNCGTIVGRTEAIFTLLKDMDAPNLPKDYWMPEEQKTFHYNEQLWYQQSFFRQPVSMKLDYYQDIANCMEQVTTKELDFSEKKIRNIECNTYPSIWHWNGGSKTAGTQIPILTKLGYRPLNVVV